MGLTNVYVVAVLATIGGMIQGFDVSLLAAVQATPEYKNYFGHPDSVTQGGITASMAGGSLLGSLFASWTGDRIGRRDTLGAGCIVFMVGAVIMCAVQNQAMLIASRVISGFAVGMLTSQGPIYIAEISPARIRGRLISLQQWMITWGILIMYYISYGATFTHSNAAFRIPWGLQMLPAVLLLAAVPFMPRSPRWLASNDRWEEAMEVLAALRARGDRTNPEVVAEMQEIQERIQIEEQYKSTSWAEVFSRRNIIRVHVAVFSHIWSQYSGMNALMYYIVYIFQMAGLSGTTTLTISSIQYVINVVMTVPALLFIDKLPRRKVMMTGSFFMATWLFIAGAVMATQGHAVPGGLKGSPNITWVVSNPAASKAIIALMYMFVATYACTWGPMGWIYPSEIIPLYIRSKAVSLATVFNWTCNFSLTFMTPPGFQNIQWRLYMVFGTFSLCALIHVFFFFHETKGRSLEDMSTIFDSNTFAFGKIRNDKLFETRVRETEEKLQTEHIV